MAVETAKRLLTKEQIDKRSGQATTSPFMKTSQEKSKSKKEKKVSFSAIESMEITTDSIERLVSLMDKIDTKLDRRDNQYRPRIHQGRRRCGYRQNKFRSRNRSYSSDHYQNNYRGNYSGNRSNRNYRSNYRDSSRSRERETIEMGAITDQTTEGTIVTKGIETEVQVRIVAGPGKEIGAVQEKVPNPEVEINIIEIRVEIEIEDRVKIIQETEKIDPDLNQGKDQAPM